jgi:mono/diheme cytochrome c family protein
MRHLLANIITYTIAALLFIGAAAFAWMRSEQLTLTTEPVVLARYVPAAADTGGLDAAAAAFRWQELGARGYQRNCRACHGADGQGWDQYPPVAQAVASLADAGGREHLIDVMLHGLDTDRWGAPMPRMRHMQDVEIAAVLNYIAVAFMGAPLEPVLMPGEVSARRAATGSSRSRQ